jgi:hypothetical protein
MVSLPAGVNLCQISQCCLFCSCLSSYCLQAGPTLCTYLYSQAIFWHVLVAATPVIREGNAIDRKTLLLEGVYLVVHTSLYFTSPLQHRAVYVSPTHKVWYCVWHILNIKWETWVVLQTHNFWMTVLLVQSPSSFSA